MGCGRDGLQWETVRKMLRYIFKNSGVTIYVYTKDELTEEEKMQLIRELHINPLGGHQGVSRTFNRLYAEHHWKGMRKQIEDFVKKCPSC